MLKCIPKCSPCWNASKTNLHNTVKIKLKKIENIFSEEEKKKEEEEDEEKEKEEVEALVVVVVMLMVNPFPPISPFTLIT